MKIKALFGCPLPSHSSLITYYSKYPNFLRWYVWHLFPTFDNSKNFTFCGTQYLSTMSGSRLAYLPHTHSHLISFYFSPSALLFCQNPRRTQRRKSKFGLATLISTVTQCRKISSNVQQRRRSPPLWPSGANQSSWIRALTWRKWEKWIRTRGNLNSEQYLR